MSYPLNNQQCVPQQTMPYATCGAVSINIMNPTVGMANPMCQPCSNGLYQYPQASLYAQQPTQMQYPMNYNNNINTQSPMNAINSDQPNTAAVPPAPQPSAQETKTEEKKDEKKEEKLKEKVPLTDEYIMSLENYLNSQDSKIRLMAAKDILERFKEDSTRKNDAALTALLNKILQDPNSAVRFLGLTTLEAGYASGDDKTVQILKSIQADGQKEYGEDSLLASQILLNMSAGDKVKFKPADGEVTPDETAKDNKDTTKEAA